MLLYTAYPHNLQVQSLRRGLNVQMVLAFGVNPGPRVYSYNCCALTYEQRGALPAWSNRTAIDFLTQSSSCSDQNLCKGSKADRRGRAKRAF